MDDAELAARARAGDREAFGILVSRYAGQARRIAWAILLNPHDGDDAVQDGLLAALKKLQRYDPTRPFGPWLLRVVANAAADRRRRRQVRQTEPIPANASSRGPGPDVVAERSELRAALERALAELPERQRVAIVMFDAEGYAHRDIAEVLNVPEGTVRSDVFHARRRLREALGSLADTRADSR